jgi:hypothetical protein
MRKMSFLYGGVKFTVGGEVYESGFDFEVDDFVVMHGGEDVTYLLKDEVVDNLFHDFCADVKRGWRGVGGCLLGTA